MHNISKQLVCQKYIFKIHSSRLRKAKWDLTLPINEARRNDEVISLADSQVLRWIDELNGITDADEQAHAIKNRIKAIRQEKNSPANKKLIKQLYDKLDTLQFKPDYMCLIIDRKKDYYRACNGFKINGILYKRLLGTNGGIKNSTIVFVSDRLVDELRRRIENGRNLNVLQVTAKLEAYKALTCSASNPVSFPNGILVVPDVETTFRNDIIYLSDESDGEPIMEDRKNEEITIDATDGFGLMLPSLAKRWSEELELGYVASAMNTRWCFEKGVVVTFDFLDFADSVANTYIVKDAWGDEVDIRNVEIVLTTSMLKLWDSYDSCEDYIANCNANKYTFGIAKTSPKELENERATNYQFLQGYSLTDEDIDELIAPTMQSFKDVLGGDWRKTILFLKGCGLNDDSVERLSNDFVKAIMINPDILNDPFVQSNVYQIIKNKINEAKVGVLNIHANYSIVCGDPYILCQSIFGLETTGLLKAGEIYNKYWCDVGSDTLACFRAPMSVQNNVRRVHPVCNDEMSHWYQYITTCTIFNAWDTATAALNGCDFDGDIVFLTDNNVLVNKLDTLPALMCAQRKAEKKISTEQDFINSNISSFGNEIGSTTNRITSMYEVRSGYPVSSDEYKVLSYRIKCGQLYQQNSIDKAKGIICKPMPKTWYDWHSVNEIEDKDTRALYRSIIADKKPYFMIYIYPNLRKQYNTYIKDSNVCALMAFRLSIDELSHLPYSELTERQREFLQYYYKKMPVGTNDCVMNIICKKFEEEFDAYISKHKSKYSFDYHILRGEADYTYTQYLEIKRLYEDYNRRLKSYALFAKYERTDDQSVAEAYWLMNSDFQESCSKVCPNAQSLCNIILDLCYQKNSSKRFAWSMCGNEIIHNLLEKSEMEISYPVISEDGDFEYCGEKFEIHTKRVEEDE